MQVLRKWSYWTYWPYWAAGIITVFVTAIDLTSDPDHSTAAAYSVLPLLVAINGRAPAVWVAGTIALALTLVMSARAEDLFQVTTGGRIVAVVGATVIALYALRERLVRERKLTQVTRVADAVQRAVLPEQPERVGPYAVAVSYEAAADEAKIGGDFYKVQATGFGTRGVIGDVRGHGLSAVRTTAMAIGVFREASHESEDLAQVAAWMDRSLGRDTGPEGFSTVLVFNAGDDGVWTGLTFGHPCPLVRTAAGAVREVRMQSGVPLGIGLYVPDPTPDMVTVSLAAGDELLLVTDGVLEARDSRGQFFPLIRRYATAPRDRPPAAVLAALRRDLEAWAPQIHDDSAFVLLRYTPEK
ncbi:hypothetical protein SRB5_60520 [Streptomyces sp. RB5]|uniref:PPM-type phosphatase domain-containing protein n=1 Tax=Streptomyces smaragdinus TaxID=2585196 RepID=A0A7K0CQU9_9ACTN|nr:PP2C family protein-serine/threonine phosphatase [Streptomyces smaragdinus]MQY15860.1 hypothetical protein [Streptomyces smaragdinus]